ncbi:MAG: glycosyltransferase family 4 protein [Armatimonadota bacterium]
MSRRITVAHVATADITLRYMLLPQLTAMQREGYAVAGISSPGAAAAGLTRVGITYHAIESLNRRWNPLADLRALIDLWRLFRRERFTIVHTHAPKTGVLGRVAARLAGIPIVVNTVHGLYGIDRGPRARWFFLTLERLAACGSDHEFCQSREDLDLLTRLRIIDPARSAYLGNGVDLQHFDPAAVNPVDIERLRADMRIPAESLVVGTVGRLVWEKGYREFLAAVELVRRARPDVTFIVVGPAEASKQDGVPPNVVRVAEERGVRFLGMRTDMRELYSLMDVFVLASYREGFPRSAIEAAAMGKPLVLTDIRGCREVVAHGRNGLLVPAQQATPLADAILALVADDGLRRRFGQASRVRALQEFDERRVIGCVLDVYKRLLVRKELLGDSAAATVQAIGSESAAQR